jgi:ribosomal protein S6
LDRSDSEISETDQYLLDVEENFGEIFKPLDEKISKIRDQLGRIEDVHTKKLKKMERNIRQHQKEASKLKEKIPSWCDEQMSLFASEIKDSLNQFNATVTRLEIMGTRRIKKLKKGFRDYVDE